MHCKCPCHTEDTRRCRQCCEGPKESHDLRIAARFLADVAAIAVTGPKNFCNDEDGIQQRLSEALTKVRNILNAD